MNAPRACGLWLAGVVLALAFFSGPPCFGQSGFQGICPNGAPARQEKFCPFVVYFRTGPVTLDRRIADNLGVESADQTRSIAFVIAIEKYPIVNDDISAAKVDGDKLEDFFKKQKFDEVIVLRNGDATLDNINYFLKDYLLNRPIDFHGKTRLVIAYSGHGRPEDGAEQAAFLLSAIDDLHSSNSIYGMDDFSGAVKRLSSLYFQVLTLVNACYGGNFFSAAALSGVGSPDTPDQPGSWAITAGDQQKRVPALNPDRGSLFFDLLIDGVNRGVADPTWWEVFGPFDKDGKPIRRDGLTRTGALRTYLASAYMRIDQLRPHIPTNEKLVSPWSGPIQSEAARGGFFFLSDAENGSPRDLIEAYGTNDPSKWSVVGNVPVTAPVAQSFSLPPGPVSSVPNRPDIKVFKQPGVYPIHGYDFSSVDGRIDWQRLKQAAAPRFAYARAIGWRGPDPSFPERWGSLKDLGIDRGAYIKFDFCRSAADQLRTLQGVLGSDASDMLPVAIELVTPDAQQDQDQRVAEFPCYKNLGRDVAKNNILTLAQGVREQTGKVPIIYGNRYNLSNLTDDRFTQYMLWLAAFSQTANQYSGANPWTLWQYSGTENVPGVGDRTTAEVFFGTEAQYLSFRQGGTNVALQAVAPK